MIKFLAILVPAFILAKFAKSEVVESEEVKEYRKILPWHNALMEIGYKIGFTQNGIYVTYEADNGIRFKGMAPAELLAKLEKLKAENDANDFKWEVNMLAAECSSIAFERNRTAK